MGGIFTHQNLTKSVEEIEADIITTNKITANSLFSRKTGYYVHFFVNKNFLSKLSGAVISYEIVNTFLTSSGIRSAF
jgi:hypothetical protein